jgi:hypothetical protein
MNIRESLIARWTPFVLVVALPLGLMVWLNANGKVPERAPEATRIPSVIATHTTRLSSTTDLSNTVMPISNTFALHAVAALSSSDVWVVGDTWNPPTYDAIVHWNGQRWEHFDDTALTTLSQRSYCLYAVAALSSSDVWAVGDYDYVSHSTHAMIVHWDGKVWSLVPNPMGQHDGAGLRTLAAIAPDDIWAAGPATLLHWDGKVWQSIATPIGEDFVSLTVGRDHNVWGLGGSSSGSVARWDGKAWHTLPPAHQRVTPTLGPALLQWLHGPPRESFTGIAALDSSDIWVVGNSTTGDAMTDHGATDLPIIRHWDGTAWQDFAHYFGDYSWATVGPRIQRPEVPQGQLGFYYGEEQAMTAVAAVASDDIWTLGSGILHWNGRAWNGAAAAICNNTQWGMDGIAAIPGERWIVGRGYHIGPGVSHWQGYVLRYTDRPCAPTPTP